MDKKLLEAEDLRVSFKLQGEKIEILRGIDIKINEGEIVGILGESGSGKTVFATTIMGLIKDEGGEVNSGRIVYGEKDLTRLGERETRELRGRDISYIFQEPGAALNPYMKVGKQIEEVLRAHKIKFDKDTVLAAMKASGIDDGNLIYEMYPSQLSGGQCQRVMIAMATILKPRLIIADEPTTAIDASLQKKVIELILDINKRNNTAVLLITHDFEVAKYLCSRIIIMYGGLVMEEGSCFDVMSNPLHPYTRELLNCVKSLNCNEKRLYTLDGMPPSPFDFKEECPFLKRCSLKNNECENKIPSLIGLKSGRTVRCVHRIGGE